MGRQGSIFEDTMEAVERIVFSPDKTLHVSELCGYKLTTKCCVPARWYFLERRQKTTGGILDSF